MLKNPLTEAAFFTGFAISALVSDSWSLWMLHAVCLTGIVLLQQTAFAVLWKRVRHLVLFFPILLGIFLISSLIFSNISLVEALQSGSFSMLRFLLAGLCMSAYLERERKNSVFQSVRSIWSRMEKPWQKVEDIFLFLGLTLRFYPSIQRQWAQLQSSHASLGLNQDMAWLKKTKSLLSDLPGFLIFQLNRAGTASLAMSLRGYGNHVPRGVAEFVPFGILDGLKLLITITAFVAFHHFAPF